MDKSKASNQTKHIPKDAQVIMSVMREMDITDYETRVINQLLEFTYRYVACILEDAKSYANHAKKKSIDLDDVKLALQIQLEQTFTAPPPREVLTDAANQKNNSSLPLIKPHCGIRLPQDRFCLSTSNLKLKLQHFSKKVGKMSFMNNMPDRNIKIAKPTAGIIKRSPTMTTISRTQTVNLPKVLQKFTTTGQKTPPASNKPKIQVMTNTSMNIEEEDVNPLKRKREEFEMN